MELTDRVAVITGGSRGLGAGIAEELARRGVRIGVCARTLPELAANVAIKMRADVTDEAAMAAFADRVTTELGPIDLWINNAGVLEPIGPLREVEVSDFRSTIDINVVGVFLGTREFVRHLRGTGRTGVLINISSGAAYNGYAGWSAYCASKAAVDLMTESVQLEEVGAGLRAHSVAPGVIDTDMQAKIRACTAEQFPMIGKFLEMKRTNSFRTAQEVATDLLSLAFDPAYADAAVRLSLPL